MSSYKTAEINFQISTLSSDIRTNATFFSQDYGLGKFRFKLINNTLPLDLTGATAILTIVTADQSTFQYTCDIGKDPTQGIAEIVLDKDVLQHIGTATAELTIVFSDSQSLSAGQFKFVIAQSLSDQSSGAIQYYIQSIENLKVQYQQEWESWFNTIKGQLGSDPAGNLQNQINDVTAQLAQTDAIVTDQEKILKSILTDTNVKQVGVRGITYYQAVIKNPIGANYINVPIAIKVKFDQGECPSVNNILVKDADGNVIPFQWEGEKHPNYLLSESMNLSTYSDGSLNGGTIWLMGSLLSGSTATYTVEVYTSSVNNGYSDNCPMTVNTDNPDAPKDEISAGICKFQFDYSTGNYHLRRYFQNDVELGNGNGNVIYPYIKDVNSVDVIPIYPGTSNWASTKSVIGNGTVFRDYIVTNTLISNTNIVMETRYRVFANGLLLVDSKLLIKENLTSSNLINGFGLIFKALKLSTDYTAIDEGMCGNTTSNQGFLYRTIRASLERDVVNYSETYTNGTQISNLASSNEQFVYTYNMNNKKYPQHANSLFTIKTALLPITSATDVIVAQDQLFNMLAVHATKYDNAQLTKKYLGLCKSFTDHMHGYIEASTFPGLAAYENFAYTKLNGIIREQTNADIFSKYLTNLQSTYGDLSTESFKNYYLNTKGIEFIGRDTSPIPFFLKQSDIMNKTSTKTALINLIHSLADFYVWVETYSGANGTIILNPNGTNISTLNAQATAMKGLKRSLDLEANSTRQTVYDRIKNNFLSLVRRKTVLPYSGNYPVTREGLLHYHGFSLFEYLEAVGYTPEFDTASWINQTATASGKLHELGFSYAPERFGFIHTSLYCAYVMYRYNTISSLQTACSIMENVVSQCLPSGNHVYPLDGWKKQINSIDAPIEIQVAYQALMEITLSN